MEPDDGPGPPGGLTDDAHRLAWLRDAYFGVDGRWYLKVRERTDAATAQETDEAVMRSLGRLHVRSWQRLTGVEEISDCRVLGRFVQDVLDVLYGDHRSAITTVRSEADCFEMRHVRCMIFEMGVAAGYEEDPVPGALPGCGGIRALAEGWARAAGDFVVEQRPASGAPHGVACHYVFRRAPTHTRPPER